MSEYHAVVHDIEICVDGLGDSVLDPLMGFEEEVTGSLSRLKNDASDVASHAVGNTALRERISATGVNAIPIDGVWAPTIPIPYQYHTNTLPIPYQIGRVLIINFLWSFMHLPRDPPRIESILSDERISKDILSEEIEGYAKDFNKRYLHWSEVRYRDTGQFDPDTVWARMKLVRMDDSVTLVFGKTQYRYCMSDRIMKMLREFDVRAAADFFPNVIDPHGKVYYSVSSLMEESIASSQMEGAVTTTKRAKEMLRKNIRPKDGSERMIVNNYRAMMFIKDHTDR